MIHSYLIKADTLMRFYQVINLAAAFNGIGFVVNCNTGNERKQILLDDFLFIGKKLHSLHARSFLFTFWFLSGGSESNLVSYNTCDNKHNWIWIWTWFGFECDACTMWFQFTQMSFGCSDDSVIATKNLNTFFPFKLICSTGNYLHKAQYQ